MNFQEVLIILAIWPNSVHFQSVLPGGYYLKLVGFKCTGKEEFFENVTCKTKAVGRYETALTVIFNLVTMHKDVNVRGDSNRREKKHHHAKRILHFQFEFKMVMKKSNNEYLHLYGAKYKYCRSFYGTAIPKFVQDHLVNEVRDFAPELVMPCPLKVSFEFSNIFYSNQ